MSTDTTIESAIERLYEVFAPYRNVSMDDYCTHCVNEQEYARAVEPDRRDVSAEAIHHYAGNAIHTWGDDLAPFLDAWQDRLDRPGLALLLAIYLMHERETLLEADECDTDSSSTGWTQMTWSQMREWLRKPELTEAFESHFVDEDDPATSYRLGLAIELLEEFQGE